jgi:hypothetical protein
MPLSNPALWQAIMEYDFPVAPRSPKSFGRSRSLTFPEWIERSFEVTGESAARMIDEYRRFIYLKAIDGGTLTPSRRVDQVWHSHIEAGENAWSNFCAKVLGTQIDHRTNLSAQESASAYERTLALYRVEFGQTPPPDIWPSKAQRVRRMVGILVGVPGVALFFGGILVAFAVAFLPSIFPLWLASGEPFWLPYTSFGGIALIVVGALISWKTDVDTPSSCG